MCVFPFFPAIQHTITISYIYFEFLGNKTNHYLLVHDRLHREPSIPSPFSSPNCTTPLPTPFPTNKNLKFGTSAPSNASIAGLHAITIQDMGQPQYNFQPYSP